MYQKVSTYRSLAAATIATSSVVIFALIRLNETSNVRADDQAQHVESPHKGVIEVDFLDKIAHKPYLTYHNIIGHGNFLKYSTMDTPRRWRAHSSRYSNRKDKISNDIVLHDNEELEFKKLIASSENKRGFLHDRPKGIPKRLRVLTIDVPTLREVFDGECRATSSRHFPHDVAPRKRVKQSSSRSTNNKEKHPDAYIDIIQKSLAQSLVRCRSNQNKKIGVEIVEASILQINPHNMRRTYQVGAYKYDPGNVQSTHSKNRDLEGMSGHDNDPPTQPINDSRILDTEESGILETADDDQVCHNTASPTAQHAMFANNGDEIYAPWHQYAWMEELHLRIHGNIPFGEKLERSSILSRYVFGHSYRSTIASQQSWYSWIIPSFLFQGIYAYKGIESDGIDGEYGNRASNKPHAVVADGSALQRVPGSLRYLVKCCKDADVPLFIINDQRVWVENTHSDLLSAAQDMRRTVKARMVARALLIKEGGLFERGRILGQLETEAKWHAKDLGRRTRHAMQEAFSKRKKEKEDDWSSMGAKELIQRLLERKVIGKSKSDSDEDYSEFSEGFVDVCLTCIEKNKSK